MTAASQYQYIVGLRKLASQQPWYHPDIEIDGETGLVQRLKRAFPRMSIVHPDNLPGAPVLTGPEDYGL